MRSLYFWCRSAPRVTSVTIQSNSTKSASSQVILSHSGFALELEATEVNETIIKFNVVGGILRINETNCVMIEGNVAVIRDKHGFLLQATGTSPDGQPATFKLAGRYLWRWEHLHVARVAGSLPTESGKTPCFCVH